MSVADETLSPVLRLLLAQSMPPSVCRWCLTRLSSASYVAFFHFSSRVSHRTIGDAVDRVLDERERIGIDFRTELFNAFNNVIFAGPQTNVTSADFGKIRLSQVNTPRQIQFGLRFSY